MTKKIRTFREFWPHYLSAHSQPRTRAWHYVGTLLAIVFIIVACTLQLWWLILAALISGYGCAWMGHACVECNRPATFGHALWSMVSDLRMLFHFVTGTLDRELEKARAESSEP